MSEIEANGVRIHLEVKGEGPPLVFVHGMCGRGAVWAGQVERLSDRFTCVTYDRRGHGASGDADEVHSVPLHGDDFAELVKALGLPPAIYVGSSGGARIGADVVLRYPELLAGAVLSEPPVFSLNPEQGKLFMGKVVPEVQPHLDTGDLPGAVDAFFGVVCPGLWRLLGEKDKTPRHEVDLLCDAADDLLTTRPPDEALSEWMQRFVAHVAMKRGMATALHSMMAADRTLFDDSRAHMRAAAEGLLAAGVAAGSICDDIDAMDLLRAIGGVCMSAGDQADWPQAAQRLVGLLFDGLRTGAPRAAVGRG
jgi:pimeloyl-ACP methyl ester carboxylesterase